MTREDYYKQIFDLTRQINMYVERDTHFALSRGEGGILCALKQNPDGLTPGELSKIMDVGTGRIGNALKNMENKGIILRKDDSNDRRKTVVTLTEKGYALVSELQTNFESRIGYVIDTMGKENFEKYLSLSKEFIETFIGYSDKEDTNND